MRVFRMAFRDLTSRVLLARSGQTVAQKVTSRATATESSPKQCLQCPDTNFTQSHLKSTARPKSVVQWHGFSSGTHFL